MRLLQLLIFGHVHKWIILKEQRLFKFESDIQPVGTIYILQCEKCGAIKRREV